MKILLILVLIIISAIGYCDKENPTLSMYPPPWKDNGGNLKELVKNEELWAETRNKIDTIGYWAWLLSVHFNDTEQTAFFSKLNNWGKKLSLEIPVVKGHTWGGTNPPLNGTTAFEFYLKQDQRFKQNGMKTVDSFVFDEPIYASRHVIPSQIAEKTLEIPGYVYTNDPYKRMDYGTKEVAKFIKSIRKLYPKAKIGCVEPYPVMPIDELKYAFDEINKECVKIGTKQLDFFRLDVDWSSLNSGQYKGSWLEVKTFGEYVSKKADFSMIYWASDMPALASKGISYDMNWYVSIMNQGAVLKNIDLLPDEYVIESWLQMPNNMTPETDIMSYTKSVLDFSKYIIGK